MNDGREKEKVSENRHIEWMWRNKYRRTGNDCEFLINVNF